jgi:hypothetical protein
VRPFFDASLPDLESEGGPRRKGYRARRKRDLTQRPQRREKAARYQWFFLAGAASERETDENRGSEEQIEESGGLGLTVFPGCEARPAK